MNLVSQTLRRCHADFNSCTADLRTRFRIFCPRERLIGINISAFAFSPKGNYADVYEAACRSTSIQQQCFLCRGARRPSKGIHLEWWWYSIPFPVTQVPIIILPPQYDVSSLLTSTCFTQIIHTSCMSPSTGGHLTGESAQGPAHGRRAESSTITKY